MKNPIWKLNSALPGFMVCLGSEVCNEDEKAVLVYFKWLFWVLIGEKL